jgi:hypothetical protein
MTQQDYTQRPITPSPELVQQWMAEIWHEGTPVRVAASDLHIATQAARWGADQELEAVEEEIITQGWFANSTHRRAQLRAARRPKPLSLKEQALEALDRMDQLPTTEDKSTIRRVLEQLPD